MKLRIELDIEPSETKLAEELLATIRSLTENVKINLRTSSNSAESSTNIHGQRGTTNGVKTPALPSAAGNSRPQLPPQGQQKKPIPPGLAPHAPANSMAQSVLGPSPKRSDAPFDFIAAFAAFEAAVQEDSPTKKQMIGQKIISSLPESLDTPEKQEVFQAFTTIYEAALWKTGSVENSTTLDLCFLLPRVPSPLLEELKKSIISKAMKHLMIKRPLDVDRTEFFPQAETFAAMVKLEFVLMPGAIQTIMQLLKKQETCAAAITMLGKTVELCAAELKDQCDPSKLVALRTTLEGTHHKEIEYDKEYIVSTMEWTPVSGLQIQPQAAPEPQHQQQPRPVPKSQRSPVQGAIQSSGNLPSLEPIAIWSDYNSQVRAVALDDENQQVMTINAEGVLFLHSFEGDELAKHNLQQHKYATMDFSPASRILVLAANTETAAAPLFAAYQVSSRVLQPLGRRNAQNAAALISKLRFLAKSNDQFFAVEEMPDRHALCLYDSKAITGSGDDVLMPLQVLEAGQITAISNVPASNKAFLTADKSGSVNVWQVGVDRPAAVLEAPEKNDDTPPNASVITCLDVLAHHLVVAGTFMQGINVWDLRGLQNSTSIKPCANIRLDTYAVTRIARFGDVIDRLCMVAATQTIRTVRLNEDGTLSEQIEGQKASDKFYYDAKWSSASGRLTLFAASAAGSLDVYSAS